MPHLNIEIKARIADPERIRRFLLDNSADYLGLDEQTDTYFNVAEGRLKLRQGVIENSLIFYRRANISGPKQSDFELWKLENGEELKSILTKALGVKVTVRKSREIFFIRNVKFHIDRLQGIGDFVEIEAMNWDGLSKEKLYEQCSYYMDAFEIVEKDLISLSYSDLLESIIIT